MVDERVYEIVFWSMVIWLVGLFVYGSGHALVALLILAVYFILTIIKRNKKETLPIENKVVLITGCDSGIWI